MKWNKNYATGGAIFNASEGICCVESRIILVVHFVLSILGNFSWHPHKIDSSFSYSGHKLIYTIRSSHNFRNRATGKVAYVYELPSKIDPPLLIKFPL